ncbi:MAG: methylated-DNA--[Desulfovibrio sp.]|nr:methylated-DNA--[protein]-cysteine S-methyltransferase [Desulfovibrio sp.]
MFSATIYLSPLGGMLLTANDVGLVGLRFASAQERAVWAVDGADVAIAAAKRWLDCYFSGQEPDFTPPLHVTGTEFCRSVWRLLLHIPYGQTVTYGHLAAKIARQRGLKRMAAQAVGQAVGRNPLAIIIPCHRVLGVGGKLTGYAGGLDKKCRLLQLERAWPRPQA